MPQLSAKELIKAGVHFGHRVSKWNPKMKSYIYGKRNLIHIIDIRETIKGIIRASRFLTKIVPTEGLPLLVGTKRQARESVERAAKRCGIPYVSERWLGGTLTNFTTIRSRLNRLKEVEEIEASSESLNLSKKYLSSLRRELRRLRRNLDGIRDMNKLPSCLIVIDPRREYIAVKEAQKLGIPVIAVIDTDGDPDNIDIPIPANDDSIRSIQLIIRQLTRAILQGQGKSLEEIEAEEAKLKKQAKQTQDAVASVSEEALPEASATASNMENQQAVEPEQQEVQE